MTHISIKHIFKAIRLSPIIVISLAIIIGFSTIVHAADTPAINNFTATPYSFNPSASNPINQSTNFSYTLSNIVGGHVVLEIVDAGNNVVRTIDGGFQSSGTHSISWDGRDENGNPVSDGTYTGKITISTGDNYSYILEWGNYGYLGHPYSIAVDSLNNVYVADIENNCIHKFDSNGDFDTKWGSYGTEDGQFDTICGIATDSSNNIYVLDTENNRIQKFDSNGAFISKWGSYGTEDGQFNLPCGITVDSSGYVYVADTGNHRIQKFNPDGTFLAKWGSEGEGDSQFSYPSDVAVDLSGYVYVADTGNDRIQKFNSSGTFLAKWGSEGEGDGEFNYPYDIAIGSEDNGGEIVDYIYVLDPSNNCVQKFDSNGNLQDKWGSYGSGDGEFDYPYGIDLDSSGKVYIADSGNERIQKLNSNGTLLTQWNLLPRGGEFSYPTGIGSDSAGNIYVADSDNHRIQKFDSSGTFLSEWGSEGSGPGEFCYPSDVAVDSSGYIYVVDTDNHRIQKFDSSGTFLAEWGSEGEGDGEFSYPYGIVIDSSNYIYVVDTENHRIQKFDSSGTFLAEWGSEGEGDSEFCYPYGIAIDSSNYIYVVDTENHRIQKFDSSGTFLAEWGSKGSGDDEFRYPSDVAVDSSGYIYVVDTENHRIQRFKPDGTFDTEWGSEGEGDSEFCYPYGIAIDSSNYIYVVDTENHRIQKFSPPTAFSNIISETYVIIDSTPPVTTASLSGTLGDNDWYTSDVIVTLTATDSAGGAGIARTEYSFDNVNWTIYSGPFTVSTEGATNLYYHSIDSAGNIEIEGTTEDASYSQLDMSAVFNADAYTGGQNYWDDIGCYYPINPGTTYSDPIYEAVPIDMQEAGSNNVWLSSGNDRTSSFPTSLTLDVNVSQATNIWVVGLDGGWCHWGSQVNIRYILDGVKYVNSYMPNDWCYEGTGDGLQLWVDQHSMGDIAIARIDLPETGHLTQISIEDTSGVGGASIPVFAVTVRDESVTSKSITMMIDKTSPVVTITAPLDEAYYTSSTLPTTNYSASDANSYTVTESGYSDEEGTHTYTVTVIDDAGNSTTASVTYTVDDTAPVVSITAPADGNFYTSSSLPAAAFDVTESSPYTVTESGYSIEEGTHTYTVTVTDDAGNSTTASVTYTVDDTAPVVTPPANITVKATGPLTPVDIGIATATDNVSVVSITNNAPADGFPVGTTIVTWTAVDAAGNEGTATQNVIVEDDTVIIDATVDIKPDTLNLKSNSIWRSVTAFIELPSGYSVREIDVSTVELEVNGVTIPAYLFPTWVGDYDWDRIPDRMVMFSRRAVIKALAGETGDITMTITGQLNDGQEFAGSDTVRVINHGWWWWDCDDDYWWNHDYDYNDDYWWNHDYDDNCWCNHKNNDDDDENKDKVKEHGKSKDHNKDNKYSKSKGKSKGRYRSNRTHHRL